MASNPTKALRKYMNGMPEALRESLLHWIEKLGGESRLTRLRPQDVGDLLRLVASSQFAGAVLLREWDWFCGIAADDFPNAVELQEEVNRTLAGVEETRMQKTALRRLRQRFTLQILWNDINARDADAILPETLQALSDLADVLIGTSVQLARKVLDPRYGDPVDDNGDVIPLVTLAMGKLGGRELNFSSDVDLIFLYKGEGETSGARKQTAHEYFTRLTQQVVALLDEVTEDGFVYRVDTRLRPFGESGPPVVSFAALENYLLRHGRSWERYAYIKARTITPGTDHAAVLELQQELIEPFVYRRYLDYGVFESLRNMKSKIAEEVRNRELANNIKLGPGGIREIEFIAQSLQLVRGGADARLRRRGLQVVMPLLGQTKDIAAPEVTELLAAYRFLRRLENAMQAVRDQQTHDIPADETDRARLQVALGLDGWDAVEEEVAKHRQVVNKIFAQVAFRTGTETETSPLVDALSALWEASAGEDAWAKALANAGFSQADEIASAVSNFSADPTLEKIGAITQRRLGRFVPVFVAGLGDLREAGVACRRVLTIVTKTIRRSAYIALLNENPATLKHLVVLCEQSAYLAGEIARYPILLDEMFDQRIHTEAIDAASMQSDLQARINATGSLDSEQKVEILARFQRATMFRIAVADFSGNLPIMKVSDRLTELAEIVIASALDIAWQDLVDKHGAPVCTDQRGTRQAGLGIIAYGKLGGIEMSYRSDLDLVFLHDSHGAEQFTNGLKPIDNSMFFSRVARRLVHFLTTQTSSGALYEVDTRLRPSGRSGLPVSNLEGFERYQEENAWTWEHQALLRSRPVAGNNRVAREFERIRADTLGGRVKRDTLLAEVCEMRARMRKQLDKSTARLFDLKQGRGGIGDIEFIVQYLVLKNAARYPAVIHYPDNIRQLGALGAAECLEVEDASRLQECYRTYRLRLHHLVLNDAPSLIANDEFATEREFVNAVWSREMA